MSDQPSAAMPAAASPPAKSEEQSSSMVPLLIIAAVAAMLAIAGSINRTDKPITVSSATTATNTVIATSAASAGSTAAATGGVPAGVFTDIQRGAIEGIVKDYLTKNPEVMLEIQQALDQKVEQQRNDKLAKALGENGKELYRDTAAPIAGNSTGDVTVVEFFDYNCGYCRRAIVDLAKLVETDKNVKVLFKEFPIFGEDSEGASKVAIAAMKQGKYWELHKAMLEGKGKNTQASALEAAGRLGLDVEKLKIDMASSEVAKEIASVRALAEKLGVNGTPHFFVGENVIPGAPEDLFDVLEKHVAEVRKSGCNIC